ncbi:uncharacterized protein LOC116223619 [Clupea harengus]|uniref:Uncharacterized protein LOC116223619 n=1 Tax=Clupea harengus TaxID=7950 RepID=A0A6P8GC03_CLUHA|nr:uncharacterized protein LOC116223619 [Clupea harengus]
MDDQHTLQNGVAKEVQYSLGNQLQISDELKDKLYPYQVEGLEFFHDAIREGRKGVILADEMGLGKSVQVISFLACMSKKQKIPSTLLIVPANLLDDWVTKIHEWTPWMTCLKYHQSEHHQAENLRKVKRKGGILVTTYETFVKRKEDLSSLHSNPYVWDFVVFDEAHRLKNETTQRYKAAFSLQAHFWILLTGTPVHNGLKELWNLLSLISETCLVGTYQTFKKNFEKPITRGREADAGADERALAQELMECLKEKIKVVWLRRTKAQLPKLPDIREFVLWTKLSPEQEVVYRHQISHDAHDLLLLHNLRKICCQSRKFDGSALNSLESEVAHSGKLAILIPLLKTLSSEGHKILVFFQYVETLNTVRDILMQTDWGQRTVLFIDGTVVLRQRMTSLKSFQNGHQSILLLTVQVGAEGLTLTAADRVIITEPSWNQSADAQAVARVHRIGQRKRVEVYRLITCGTVEEKIYRRQLFKGSLVRQVVGDDQNPLRHFTRSELMELYSLGETQYSATQLQLEHQFSKSISAEEILGRQLGEQVSGSLCGISDHGQLLKASQGEDLEAEMEKLHIADEVQKSKGEIEGEAHLKCQVTSLDIPTHDKKPQKSLGLHRKWKENDNQNKQKEKSRKSVIKPVSSKQHKQKTPGLPRKYKCFSSPFSGSVLRKKRTLRPLWHYSHQDSLLFSQEGEGYVKDGDAQITKPLHTSTGVSNEKSATSSSTSSRVQYTSDDLLPETERGDTSLKNSGTASNSIEASLSNSTPHNFILSSTNELSKASSSDCLTDDECDDGALTSPEERSPINYSEMRMCDTGTISGNASGFHSLSPKAVSVTDVSLRSEGESHHPRQQLSFALTPPLALTPVKNHDFLANIQSPRQVDDPCQTLKPSSPNLPAISLLCDYSLTPGSMSVPSTPHMEQTPQVSGAYPTSGPKDAPTGTGEGDSYTSSRDPHNPDDTFPEWTVRDVLENSGKAHNHAEASLSDNSTPNSLKMDSANEGSQGHLPDKDDETNSDFLIDYNSSRDPHNADVVLPETTFTDGDVYENSTTSNNSAESSFSGNNTQHNRTWHSRDKGSEVDLDDTDEVDSSDCLTDNECALASPEERSPLNYSEMRMCDTGTISGNASGFHSLSPKAVSVTDVRLRSEGDSQHPRQQLSFALTSPLALTPVKNHDFLANIQSPRQVDDPCQTLKPSSPNLPAISLLCDYSLTPGSMSVPSTPHMEQTPQVSGAYPTSGPKDAPTGTGESDSYTSSREPHNPDDTFPEWTVRDVLENSGTAHNHAEASLSDNSTPNSLKIDSANEGSQGHLPDKDDETNSDFLIDYNSSRDPHNADVVLPETTFTDGDVCENSATSNNRAESTFSHNNTQHDRTWHSRDEGSEVDLDDTDEVDSSDCLTDNECALASPEERSPLNYSEMRMCDTGTISGNASGFHSLSPKAVSVVDVRLFSEGESQHPRQQLSFALTPPLALTPVKNHDFLADIQSPRQVDDPCQTLKPSSPNLPAIPLLCDYSLTPGSMSVPSTPHMEQTPQVSGAYPTSGPKDALTGSGESDSYTSSRDPHNPDDTLPEWTVRDVLENSGKAHNHAEASFSDNNTQHNRTWHSRDEGSEVDLDDTDEVDSSDCLTDNECALASPEERSPLNYSEMRMCDTGTISGNASGFHSLSPKAVSVVDVRLRSEGESQHPRQQLSFALTPPLALTPVKNHDFLADIQSPRQVDDPCQTLKPSSPNLPAISLLCDYSLTPGSMSVPSTPHMEQTPQVSGAYPTSGPKDALTGSGESDSYTSSRDPHNPDDTLPEWTVRDVLENSGKAHNHAEASFSDNNTQHNRTWHSRDEGSEVDLDDTDEVDSSDCLTDNECALASPEERSPLNYSEMRMCDTGTISGNASGFHSLSPKAVSVTDVRLRSEGESQHPRLQLSFALTSPLALTPVKNHDFLANIQSPRQVDDPCQTLKPSSPNLPAISLLCDYSLTPGSMSVPSTPHMEQTPQVSGAYPTSGPKDAPTGTGESDSYTSSREPHNPDDTFPEWTVRDVLENTAHNHAEASLSDNSTPNSLKMDSANEGSQGHLPDKDDETNSDFLIDYNSFRDPHNADVVLPETTFTDGDVCENSATSNNRAESTFSHNNTQHDRTWHSRDKGSEVDLDDTDEVDSSDCLTDNECALASPEERSPLNYSEMRMCDTGTISGNASGFHSLSPKAVSVTDARLLSEGESQHPRQQLSFALTPPLASTPVKNHDILANIRSPRQVDNPCQTLKPSSPNLPAIPLLCDYSLTPGSMSVPSTPHMEQTPQVSGVCPTSGPKDAPTGKSESNSYTSSRDTHNPDGMLPEWTVRDILENSGTAHNHAEASLSDNNTPNSLKMDSANEGSQGHLPETDDETNSDFLTDYNSSRDPHNADVVLPETTFTDGDVCENSATSNNRAESGFSNNNTQHNRTWHSRDKGSEVDLDDTDEVDSSDSLTDNECALASPEERSPINYSETQMCDTGTISVNASGFHSLSPKAVSVVDVRLLSEGESQHPRRQLSFALTPPLALTPVKNHDFLANIQSPRQVDDPCQTLKPSSPNLPAIPLLCDYSLTPGSMSVPSTPHMEQTPQVSGAYPTSGPKDALTGSGESDSYTSSRDPLNPDDTLPEWTVRDVLENSGTAHNHAEASLSDNNTPNSLKMDSANEGSHGHLPDKDDETNSDFLTDYNSSRDPHNADVVLPETTFTDGDVCENSATSNNRAESGFSNNNTQHNRTWHSRDKGNKVDLDDTDEVNSSDSLTDDESDDRCTLDNMLSEYTVRNSNVPENSGTGNSSLEASLSNNSIPHNFILSSTDELSKASSSDCLTDDECALVSPMKRSPINNSETQMCDTGTISGNASGFHSLSPKAVSVTDVRLFSEGESQHPRQQLSFALTPPLALTPVKNHDFLANIQSPRQVDDPCQTLKLSSPNLPPFPLLCVSLTPGSMSVPSTPHMEQTPQVSGAYHNPKEIVDGSTVGCPNLPYVQSITSTWSLKEKSLSEEDTCFSSTLLKKQVAMEGRSTSRQSSLMTDKKTYSITGSHTYEESNVSNSQSGLKYNSASSDTAYLQETFCVTSYENGIQKSIADDVSDIENCDQTNQNVHSQEIRVVPVIQSRSPMTSKIHLDWSVSVLCENSLTPGSISPHFPPEISTGGKTKSLIMSSDELTKGLTKRKKKGTSGHRSLSFQRYLRPVSYQKNIGSYIGSSASTKSPKALEMDVADSHKSDNYCSVNDTEGVVRSPYAVPYGLTQPVLTPRRESFRLLRRLRDL